jgi:hypothetical protein
LLRGSTNFGKWALGGFNMEATEAKTGQRHENVD